MFKIKYIGFFFALILLMPTVAYAGTVSFDQLAVSTDLTTTKYNDDLNTIYAKVNYDIDTTNILNDTVAEVDMADDANVRIRTKQNAWCEMVYEGLLPAENVASLTTNITAGTAYPEGYYVLKSSATPKTYTASKWTWVDIDYNGDFQYTETAWAAATPAVAANSLRLGRVSSDTVGVNNVLDLRNTSCTDGPFAILADSAGEANLAQLLINGDGGYAHGLELVTGDANSVKVQSGAMYINGEYRILSSDLTVPVNSAGSSTAGTSGLDNGSVAASTTYYLYATADVDGVTPITGIFSTNSTTPAGPTNFRKLGEATTDAGKGFTSPSADITSINYPGKTKQFKRKITTDYVTGSTTAPADDTKPQNAETNPITDLDITPINNKTSILLTGFLTITHNQTGKTAVACIYKNSAADPLVCGVNMDGGLNNSPVTISFNYIDYPATTASVNYALRGAADTGVIYVNGKSAVRLYGTALKSGLMAQEYEA